MSNLIRIMALLLAVLVIGCDKTKESPLTRSEYYNQQDGFIYSDDGTPISLVDTRTGKHYECDAVKMDNGDWGYAKYNGAARCYSSPGNVIVIIPRDWVIETVGQKP